MKVVVGMAQGTVVAVKREVMEIVAGDVATVMP
jgi:hypothetical protein